MPTFDPKYALPVVVAPPEIVRPPACVPLPIVEEAVAPIPCVKMVSVDVEFAAEVHAVVGVKGNDPPAPVPHATPVFETTPAVENVAQPAEPTADVTVRFAVVRVPETRPLP